MSVCENYKEVEKRVEEACKRAGRKREEVTLIACLLYTSPSPRDA